MRLSCLLAVLLGLAFSSSLPAPVESGGGRLFPLKTALVDDLPAPGRAPLPLTGRVAALRHDYGVFSLVQVTEEQAASLREAGYTVRILEGAERIAVGRYSFSVPAGPAGLPADLLRRERKEDENDAYLVRLIGPATDAWLSGIRNLGGEILTPVPQFTYLTKVPAARRQEVASLPFVEWMGPYHPAFKLSNELAQAHEQGTLPEAAQEMNVLIYRWADVEAAANKIRSLQGEILGHQQFDFYDLLKVRISPKRAPDLARMTETYAVERALEPQLEDESSTQILAGQVASNVPFQPALGQPTYLDWLAARGLDGSGVTIGYVDDGVLNNDPTDHLDGRVNESVCGIAGAQGHGMFGASDAGGACSHPGESGTGFRYGLGVAPAVNFINLPMLWSASGCSVDIPARARDTVTHAGPNGALGSIQNNSWGDGGMTTDGNLIADVDYTSEERTQDILVRDADSVAAGNQPLIVCFSAGNDGFRTPGSGNDSPSSLTRPHAAKNILTTGSSSVYRPSVGASNIDDRSFFSSQGPAMDGRVKPDFMAPGGSAPSVAAIAGAFVGTSAGCQNLDGIHCLSQGTSFATPQTAGGAALLVQWWKQLTTLVPSPALVKALLINSSRDMTSGNTTDLTPNRHEGWGRWSLGNVLDPAPTTLVNTAPLFKKTSGLPALYVDQGVVISNNGDQYQLRLVPADISKPLRASLVWTDAPGAVSSCPSLVNNLDLELVQNGKTLLRGNAFNNGISASGGPADPVNNVEQVVQLNPSGYYTLTVRAVTLAGDGIPGNADTTDQDFALVVTNAISYTGPILAAGSLTSTDACAGTGAGGNGTLDPGETLTFSVPLVNTGNAAATTVSATLAAPPPGVTIVDGASSYPNISAGATGNPSGGDTFSIALSGSIACASGIDLTLNVSTGQGSFPVPLHFDVGSKTLTTQNLAGGTGVVADDINSPTNFATAAATAGVVNNVTLDLAMSSADETFLFDNYDVALVAPSSTSVMLHSNPLPCTALNASYPASRLPQVGGLDAFKGQAAGGVWTLRVTDKNNSVCTTHGPSRPCSEATVGSWTLHVTRESAAACTTCVGSTPPPEVSGPASPTKMALDYNASTGSVSFTWENLGAAADSYRLYQGSIAALAGVGVTSANTAPVQCGILSPGTTRVPPAGNLFFLVAAQKGAMIGPLGEATNPAMFPRSANQTCP